ncbi:MAG: CAP domain-containing protein [bacterium]|nr:CAP domain-containing protein [bacterium]
MERIFTLKNLLPQLKLAFFPCPENEFRPLFLQRRFLAYYLLLFLVLRLIVFPFYFLFPSTSFFAEVVSSTLIDLTNQNRQAKGLAILKENPVLTQAAYAKAQDMLQNDYFSHVSPSGIPPWQWFKKSGYNYQVAGENLAIGFLESGEVEKAWNDSPSHRQNLLNPSYKEIGIAVVKGDFQGQETTLVVQFFGTPVARPLTTPTPQPSPLISPSPLASSPAVMAGETQKSPTPKPLESIISFGVTQYDPLTSRLVSLFLLFLIGALIFNLFVSLAQGIKSRDLVLNTTFFILLFILSSFLDKQLIISLIPHNVIINGL